MLTEQGGSSALVDFSCWGQSKLYNFLAVTARADFINPPAFEYKNL